MNGGQVRVVVALAWARLRYRPARWLLVALGVTVATMLPIAAQGTATVVAAQALRYGVESLPPGDRSLAAIRTGVFKPPEEIAQLDRTARAALADLSRGPVIAQMLTRTTSDGVGGTYYFGAADGLAGLVRITEGRAPQTCTPTRCEVIVVGTGTPTLSPQVGLVIVGRAVRADPLLLSGSFDPGDGAPLLLASGVSDAAQLESLAQIQRSYSWVSPVDLDRVSALGVDGYLEHSARASIALYQERLSLTAPDQQLRAEADRAQLSARRFALLGGAATALLLGFCVIGAIGMRRDHTATAQLLRRRGARTRQVVVLAGIAGAVPVFVGAALGCAAGGLLAAAQARVAGLPAWSAAGTAVRAAGPAVAVGTVAAVLVVGVTLLVGASGNGAQGNGTQGNGPQARAAWRWVDGVVIAGLLAAGLAVARGAVTTEALSGRADPLLTFLPVIAVVCGGLLVGRAWPPLSAALSRLVPRRALAPRLGLVGAVRSPLRPVATAAFLAAAVGVVTFAGAYQATLSQGALDQAAFAVPLDATVRSGQSLRPPLDVASGEQYRAAGFEPYPVVRSSARIPVSAAQTLTPELVGVDPAALERVHAWDHVVGDGAPADVARQLRATPGPAHGIEVPVGTTTVTFAARGNLSDVDIVGWLRLPDGRDVPTVLTPSPPPPSPATPDASSGPYAGTVTGTFPSAVPAGSRLFAVTISETAFAATRRQHHEGEGGTALPSLTGSITLGPPGFATAPGLAPAPGLTPPAGSWATWGSETATVTGGDTLTVDYGLTGAKVVVRAGHGEVPAPLRVFADPVTAAAVADGPVSVAVDSGPPIAATVVGVLPRFPASGSRFLVTDVRALADALDARDPGTGAVAELWLAGDPADGVATVLSRQPFDLLRVDLRQARQDRLAADPLARGASGVLETSALLSFLVALVAVVLLVVAERRDESAQLYAWESDGVAPRTLRWSLFLRAFAVVVLGVAGGVAIGLVLSRVTTALVRVTAVGVTPVPPLAPAVTPLWTVWTMAAGIVAGLALCAVLAATSLRERLPRRPEELLV
jgi:hypothetical protein